MAAGASYVVNDLSELLWASTLSTGSPWGACLNRRAESLMGSGRLPTRSIS